MCLWPYNIRREISGAKNSRPPSRDERRGGAPTSSEVSPALKKRACPAQRTASTGGPGPCHCLSLLSKGSGRPRRPGFPTASSTVIPLVRRPRQSKGSAKLWGPLRREPMSPEGTLFSGPKRRSDMFLKASVMAVSRIYLYVCFFQVTLTSICTSVFVAFFSFLNRSLFSKKKLIK